MPRFALLKRLSTETLTNPISIMKLNREVREYVKGACPEVKWIMSFGMLGHSRPKFLCEPPEGSEEICVYDYLDIFEAPDKITASKVASIVRSFGHANVETWCDTLRDRSIDLVGDLAEFMSPQTSFEFEKGDEELKQTLLSNL